MDIQFFEIQFFGIQFFVNPILEGGMGGVVGPYHWLKGQKNGSHGAQKTHKKGNKKQFYQRMTILGGCPGSRKIFVWCHFSENNWFFGERKRGTDKQDTHVPFSTEKNETPRRGAR